MDVLMMCLHIRFAGTLREPFFKRRRDGSFYFESGGRAALALAGLWEWPTGRWEGSCGAGSLRSLCRVGHHGPCQSQLSNRYLPTTCVCNATVTEAMDDDDGMSMLVDLAGAAAAAGTAGPAAANGNASAAEQGARVKVTYSYFAVRGLGCSFLIGVRSLGGSGLGRAAVSQLQQHPPMRQVRPLPTRHPAIPYISGHITSDSCNRQAACPCLPSAAPARAPCSGAACAAWRPRTCERWTSMRGWPGRCVAVYLLRATGARVDRAGAWGD